MKRFLFSAVLFTLPTLAAAAPLYVRGGAGFEQSAGATVLDRDCTGTNPPALFGCGAGVDDRPLAARGDFGGTPSWEAALGVELRRVRREVAVTGRTELDLDARANFTGVAGVQPVHANGDSLAAMLNGAFDVAPESWCVRPFVFGGAGLSRNRTGAVSYRFPAIASDAVTVTRGGSETGFAWNAGVGASVALTPSLALDVAWRYSDLGDWRTDAGAATIVRPTRTLTIDIDGTRAGVVTRGVLVSLRYRM